MKKIVKGLKLWELGRGGSLQIKKLFRPCALSIVILLLLAALNQPAIASGDSAKIQLEKKLASEKQTEIIVQYKKTPLFQEKKFSNSIDGRIKEREAMGNGLEIIRAKDSGQVSGLLEELRKDSGILYAEKNKLLSINERPNDPYYENQWGLDAIMAEKAWDILPPYQARAVTVGVIDTGIEKTHPDLAGRIAPGGYNFLLNSSDVYDINGHGTGVAGVIAAETGNGAGIAGVTGRLNVKILPLQAANYKGSAYVSDVIRAIDYAIEKRVDVLNLSMGSGSFSDIENEAVQRAVQSGIVVVASAGNEGTQEFFYPASYDNVISVGSVARSLAISRFSNHNDRVDLVAPGEDIYSTGLNSSYVSYGGTSFAAPMAAGIASAIKAIDPALTPAEIASIIKDTAVDKGAPGWDGCGLANLYNAVNQTVAAQGELLPPADLEWPREQDNVPPAKIWRITFNSPVDIATLNNNIYVVDALGGIIPVKLSLSDDRKSVLVEPEKTYSAGQYYYLYINKDISSSNGRQLGKTIRMKFPIE